jgi:predicted RND superfamily exporter protein
MLLLVLFVLSIYGVSSFRIDNYLTDEVNTNSKLYTEMSFFNDNFGGIKPVTFKIPTNNNVDIKRLLDFESFLQSNNFSLDFSLSSLVENPELVNKSMLKKITKENYKIQTRMNDLGSKYSFGVFEKITLKAKELALELKVGGAGYLFDQVSNQLTREILYGLLVAILTIGILFVLINGFNINYFFVALIPNIFPILVAIGILCSSNFYFSLSNAFIFAIVFGLIVDDSIHILSSYRYNIKRGMGKELAISNTMNITARAVIKTTIVVIFSLLPLLLSEFKSVSQLSIITIVSAVIAIVFDLLYLPKLIKKFL